MASFPEIYHMSPTSGRQPEHLAHRRLTALANSLPPAAAVLDVGAGSSPLGRAVALLRPNIHWINLDFSYYDARILGEVSQDAPSNLAFVAGDVTKLEEHIKSESMDAVFSYWLFPHLSLSDAKPAQTAAVAIFNACKPGGILTVGPHTNPLFSRNAFRGNSWRVRKSDGWTAQTYSEELVRRTKMPTFTARLQKASNVAGMEVFGTSRYAKGKLMRQRIYDPGSGDYRSQLHPRSVYLLGKLLVRQIVRTVALPEFASEKPPDRQ